MGTERGMQRAKKVRVRLNELTGMVEWPDGNDVLLMYMSSMISIFPSKPALHSVYITYNELPNSHHVVLDLENASSK
jgi:hypothetical protein